jgi:hypothetical protein
MPSTPLKEVMRPELDAVAWEWTDTYSGIAGGYRHRVIWLRGTSTLVFGTIPPNRDEWTDTVIRNPERFGFTGDLASARIAAQAFYATECAS